MTNPPPPENPPQPPWQQPTSPPPYDPQAPPTSSFDPTAYDPTGYGQPGSPAPASPAPAGPAPTSPPAPMQPAQVYPPTPEYSAGAAQVPLQPGFTAPDATYANPSSYPPPEFPPAVYPPQGYAGQPYQQGYPVSAPGYGGYGGYGSPPPLGYPIAPQPKTNGLGVASMIVSICGGVLLICYGAGGVLGIVGAILGHVARRQIRERQEGGAGMALAGIIVGWISFGLGLLVVAAIVAFIVYASGLDTTSTDSGFDSSGFDAFRLLLAGAGR